MSPCRRPAPGRWIALGRRRMTPATGRRPSTGGAPGQLGLGRFGQVGQPRPRAPRHPLDPGRERLGQQPGPGRGADPAGRPQPALGQRGAAQQQQRGLPAGRRRRQPRPDRRLRAPAGPPGRPEPAPRPHSRTRRRAAPGWRSGRGGPRPAPAWRPGPDRGWCPRCGPSRTRCGPGPRCRTAAGRRSGRDRWRGRPTMTSTGVPARRALCRLARPLARPGPRCSSTAAGRPVIRA